MNWQELTSAAMLGTDHARAQTNPNATHDSPQSLATGLEQAQALPSPPMQLLHQAALIRGYQRAGQVAPSAPHPPTTAALPETLPRVSPRAALALRTVLEGDGLLRDCLDEWLTLTLQHQRCAPEELIPPLLDVGRQHSQLRSAIRQAIGQRGLWLAQQNESWAYATLNIDAQKQTIVQQWENSPSVARQTLFAELRERDPSQARTLLQATWKAESAEQRSKFIAGMRVRLSSDDEAFLEAALDDRSYSVRLSSAQLLARLPQSQLVQRMIARVTPYLQREGKRGLRITLPSSYDPTWVRDGIDETPSEKRKKGGERAYWLEQMLRLVPTQHWQTDWQIDIATLLKQVQASEWREMLSAALLDAAQHSADVALIEALLPSLGVEGVDYDDALAALPAARVDALAVQILGQRDATLEHASAALETLKAHRNPWSLALTERFLSVLQRDVRRNRVNHAAFWEARNALKGFALYMDSALAERTTSGWEGVAEEARAFWSGGINDMSQVLQFRHDLREAFT